MYNFGLHCIPLYGNVSVLTCLTLLYVCLLPVLAMPTCRP